VIRVQENQGIAHSINTGIAYIATTWQSSFILTMDQDSELAPGYVARALAEYSRLKTLGYEVGQVSAETTNNMRLPLSHETENYSIPFDPLQSGSLFPAFVFPRVGTFREDFVIDCVDVEFTLRLLSHRLLVVVGHGCAMRHTLGRPQPILVGGKQLRILGKPRTISGSHDPFRTYYMVRNRLIIHHLYYKQFPYWIARSTYRQLRSTIFTLIFGSDRIKHLRAAGSGIIDAIRGRLGPISSEIKPPSKG
jgi:rhamnosyltransferase